MSVHDKVLDDVIGPYNGLESLAEALGVSPEGILAVGHEHGLQAACVAFGTVNGEPIVSAETVECVIAAYLKASGLVLVPRDPTLEMFEASDKVHPHSTSGIESFWQFQDAYAAMISAFKSPFTAP